MPRTRQPTPNAKPFYSLAFTLILVTLTFAEPARSQNPAFESKSSQYSDLAKFIEAAPAVDNHAHPVLPPPNDTTDRDFDALPVDDMAPETPPIAWREDNPQLPKAWAALWGFKAANPFISLDAEGIKRLQAARDRIKVREKQHYDQWVLEQAGIRTMLANRVAMGAGIQEPALRWVPYADALLFPLDNTQLAAASPDRTQFFPLEDRLRARYLKALNLNAPPPTLAEYLSLFVTPTLEHQKQNGAVAEKFEIAYLRAFDFQNPTQADAERAYSKWVSQPNPDPADYKLLQDFLFRYIASECGRLGMAVHIHTMAGGGGYFNIAGANPLLLEPLFNDPHLRNTKFVLLHGGWPFVHEAGALLQKPNVYLDLSQEALTFPPRTLAIWLREWLETYPDKVLFGTDGYPYSDSMGWEESTWISSRNAREALTIALTGMIQDGEITPAHAKSIAEAVLSKTASTLYAR